MKNKRKKYLRIPLFIIIAVAVSAAVGTVLMIAIYFLPLKEIQKHCADSYPIFQKETNYYYWAPVYENTKLDNSTDAFMMNIAMYDGTSSRINNAMQNYYVMYSGDIDFFENVMMYINDDKTYEPALCAYGRYWHGYLLWLKPLLEFMNLQEIRMLNMALQFLLLIFVVIRLYTFCDKKLVLPFLFAILFINPVSTALCMQYSSIYYITLLSVLVITYLDKKQLRKNYYKIFVLNGIAIAFFDFFTYPLVAFGIPLIMILFLLNEDLWSELKCVIISFVCWLSSYALMWFSKWVIGGLITGDDIINNGLQQIRTRTISDAYGKDVTVFETIGRNFNFISGMPLKIFLILVIIMTLAFALSKKVKLSFDKNIIAIAIVGILPFIWYGVMRNHSYIHAYMTHRDLAVTVFAIMSALFLCFSIDDWEKGNTSDKRKVESKE